MQKQAINIDIKLGTKFTPEDANTEFKKFTISKNDLIDSDMDVFQQFTLTGKIGNKMQDVLKKLIKKYMESYIPKYISCFYNITDSPFSKTESYFYIGIDDDGTITGIPINTSLLSYTNLYVFLNNTIMELIQTKINFDTSLTNDDIYSCLDSQILIFNNSVSSAYLKKSKANKLGLVDLQNKIKKLENELIIEEQNKIEMSFLFDGLVYDEFKKNRNIINNLIKYIVQLKNFYIIDYDNNRDVNFIKECLTDYDPKSYYGTYKDDLYKTTIDKFMHDNKLKKAFKIYLNEIVKDLIHRIKFRLRKLSEETKLNITTMAGQHKGTIGTYDKFFYNFSTHIENILSHIENKHIVIKIIFKHEKYKTILSKLNIDRDTNMISYLESKNGNDIPIVVTRTLKYINDKLDPECKKL